MMLLYFYIISFIICIDCTISYNFIKDSIRSNAYSGRHVKKARKSSRGKDRNTLMRKEYVYDRRPVEFDVARFVQPDYDSMEGDDGYRGRNKSRRKSISKNLDFESLIGLNPDSNLNMKDTDLSQSMPESVDNSLPLKETVKSKHMALDRTNAKFAHYQDSKLNTKMSLNEYMVHRPEKKCIFRKMKIPFFSRNKTESTKKNKKRKIISFNFRNKDGENRTTPITQYKLKRSYIEKLCPSCKKKTVDLPTTGRKKNVTKHFNSNNRPRKKKEGKFKKEPNSLDYFYDKIRTKREGSAREQYLRELEEVQRKIDKVSVTIPKFEKNSFVLQW